MKKLFYLVVTVWSIFSCTYNTEKKLLANKTVVAIFDKAEIKDLSVIIDFFNKRICMNEQIEKGNITECYQRYFRDLENISPTKLWGLEISFKEQLQLYHKISDNTFNQIWVISEKKPRQYTFSLKGINLNLFGKYDKFLKEFGKECSIIKEINDTYHAIGSVGPGFWAIKLLENIEQMDDIRFQLVVAIHFLTLNDEVERFEKYYK